MGVGEGSLGNYPACRERLNAGLQLARDDGEPATAAGALSWLASWNTRREFRRDRLSPARLCPGPCGEQREEEARALQMLGIGADVHERDLSLARSYDEQA